MAANEIKGVVKRSDGAVTNNYLFRAEWQRNGFSEANNTSNITIKLIITNTNLATGAYNKSTKPSVTLSVNGTDRYPSIDYIDTQEKNKDCVFATWTGNIEHGEDGNLSCEVIASFTHYGSSSLGSGSLNGNIEILMPTVNLTLEPVNELGSQFDYLYIQGKSKIKAIVEAAGDYPAEVNSYRVQADGVVYTAPDGEVTTDYVAKYGDLTVYGYATDEDGNTGSAKKIIYFIPYNKPQIRAVAFRSDESGNKADGVYLTINASRTYSKVESNQVQKNFCKIEYRFEGESDWTTILDRNAGGDTVVWTENKNLSQTQEYVVQVRVVDDIGESSVTSIRLLSNENVYMHRSKNGMGLGGRVTEENTLKVYWDAKLLGEVYIGDKTLREYILDIINGG